MKRAANSRACNAKPRDACRLRTPALISYPLLSASSLVRLNNSHKRLAFAAQVRYGMGSPILERDRELDRSELPAVVQRIYSLLRAS